MAGFIYNGKSTSNILPNVELLLCSTDGAVSSVQGVTRTLMGGEPTISRPFVNEYGTIAEHLEFTYSLIKSDTTMFTYAEQIAVERWLTSPKFSLPIQITDCNGVVRYKYYGKFTTTQWYPIDDGFYAMDFTFSVNGSYAYEHHIMNLSPPPNSAVDDTDGLPNWSFTVDCASDELEEWVYPKFEIYCADLNSNPSFKLTNVTDRGNTMSVTTSRHVKYYFDCHHCIASDQSGTLHFRELGWEDVDNIYWFRLKPGRNLIGVHGDITIKLEYDSPVKIAGGWLV